MARISSTPEVRGTLIVLSQGIGGRGGDTDRTTSSRARLMSSIKDRRRTRLRTVDPAGVVDPGDPEAWRSFKPNTLTCARWFLETGELPAGTHFVIVERLAGWCAGVNAAGPEVRA